MTYLMPQFHAEGRIPVQLNEKPFDIPGFPPINACDMHHMHLAGTNPETVRTWVANSESLWEATGVLVNSAYELESAVIDGLRNLLVSKLKTIQVSTSLDFLSPVLFLSVALPMYHIAATLASFAAFLGKLPF